MKHISQNNIETIEASSQNPEFTAEMMLDHHPSRLFQAQDGISTVSIVADVVGGCSDIMFAGTNAASATVSVEDPNECIWAGDDEWGGDDEWANVQLNISGAVIQDSKNKTLWITLSERVSIPCVVTVLLSTSSGDAVNAGIMTAKYAESYGGSNPAYGLAKSQLDLNVRAVNSNGSDYYKIEDDNIKRVFGITALMLREDTRKLEAFFAEHGETPTAWNLTDKAGNDYVVFGKMEGSPQITDSYQYHSFATWRIIEVK